ncbi:polyketide cyclase [Streptomyces sp. ERV7]|uniref:nuclear transport factor 2 family protein n=1 Tax=Streptomyces sp. ERV7 TaxID=1322334 RepID=UPI0007F3439B|nr:nuclear transport factor 2 family protein [Streptomyces sp. ERV7]OAR26977.1 polyketide cyclase [Streptomyces sp. ERV7]
MSENRYETAVAHYFEAWNTTGSAGELAKAVEAAWSENGTYTDPMGDVAGYEAIAGYIAGAHAQFPGYAYRLEGAVDGHHDVIRFRWELVSVADGSAPVAGSDVVTLAGDGRVASVIGFLDRVPPTA